jgi:hypothetical protein
MSRGGNDDWDEDWPNQGAFWWHNAQRALKGKRGRKALAELREALLILPERRLVSGAISTASLAAEVADMPDTVPGWDAECTPRPNWVKKEALDKCAQEGVGVCAVGAYLLRKRVLELGESPEEAMRALPSAADIEGYYLNETAEQGRAAGLTFSLAYLLADRNDETYGSCTPEERYEKFLAWLDAELDGVQ